jgi:hypothetical protein
VENQWKHYGNITDKAVGNQQTQYRRGEGYSDMTDKPVETSEHVIGNKRDIITLKITHWKTSRQS